MCEFSFTSYFYRPSCEGFAEKVLKIFVFSSTVFGWKLRVELYVCWEGNATEQKTALNECPLVVLREMLRERGLPASGNKADLVTRLFAADWRLEQGVPTNSIQGGN